MNPSDRENADLPPVVHCEFCGISSEKAQAITTSSSFDIAICDACVEVARRMLRRDGLVPELNITHSFAGGKEPRPRRLKP